MLWNGRQKCGLCFLFAAALLALASPGFSQEAGTNPELQQKLDAFKQSIVQDQQALRQFARTGDCGTFLKRDTNSNWCHHSSSESGSSLSLASPSLVLPVKPFECDQRISTSCGSAAASFQPVQKIPLLPTFHCSPIMALNASDRCNEQSSVSTNLWGSDAANDILVMSPSRERFHWRPALWQSLEFLVFEHVGRMAMDNNVRYLLIHKPFWHDYLASTSHFVMNRWGDGDWFLINYIGHPMEGAVSGYIFIQNDPVGRAARFGKSSAYWQSRFKAMAWSAVYSAYFEIGPVLSEAAIGSEGGYTYIPGCGFSFGCETVPAPSNKYEPATNGTGWVDFIVTPTIGTGWMVMEDTIETEIVDRVAKNPHGAFHDVLLGSLTPMRTMSNLLAGKLPWYRPYNSESTTSTFGAPIQPVASRPAWKADPCWGLGLQFSELSVPVGSGTCSTCRTFVPGGGFTFSYRVARFASFDSEFNLFRPSGKSGETGAMQEVLAGFKVGPQFRSWGVFAKARPGFIHYDHALVPDRNTDYESTTRFAIDLGGVAEYYVSRRSTLRFNIGTTLVHYLTSYPDPKQRPVSVLSSDYYIYQGNFRISSGYVFRF